MNGQQGHIRIDAHTSSCIQINNIPCLFMQLDSVMGIVDKRDPLNTRGQGLGCGIDDVEFTSVV
jgi:hypothetical protein